MKKMRAIIALVLAMVMLLTACSTGDVKSGNGTGTEGDTKTTADKGSSDEVLKVWSFTNEAKVFTTVFESKTGQKVEFTMVPMTNGEYQTKLQQTLANGTDVPDVVTLEASFVRQFVESPFLADISDLKSKAEALDTFQFTIDAGTHDGEVRAYSYQATPGALFYRRSLAKEYFGTDDPAEVQALLSDFNKFEEAAKIIKEKSNGNTYIVGSNGDFVEPFLSNRENPWVVDNTLVIDPKVEELFEIAKSFRDNSYEAQTTQWVDGWFAGMNDTLVGTDGTPKQIFSYFLPTWGLPYVLMNNGKSETTDTTGDWGMIEGPAPYQWGGTWFAVAKDAKNPEAAKAFIEFATLNEETLTEWATGVYTNEYLLAIDDTVADLQQGPGDFVSSAKVAAAVQNQFDNAETSKFVGGQNSYAFFAEAAPNVSLRLMQATDDAIKRSMQDSIEVYANGEATLEEAMNMFKENVQAISPDLVIK